MRDPRQLLLFLLLGLVLASGALVVIAASADLNTVTAANPQGCLEQASCGSRRLWLDPDKARRFAEVFRS